MKSLYELTGDIKDFNTMLVNRDGLKKALEALDQLIPSHLRTSRHGENYMGSRYATIRAALLGGEE